MNYGWAMPPIPKVSFSPSKHSCKKLVHIIRPNCILLYSFVVGVERNSLRKTLSRHDCLKCFCRELSERHKFRLFEKLLPVYPFIGSIIVGVIIACQFAQKVKHIPRFNDSLIVPVVFCISFLQQIHPYLNWVSQVPANFSQWQQRPVWDRSPLLFFYHWDVIVDHFILPNIVVENFNKVNSFRICLLGFKQISHDQSIRVHGVKSFYQVFGAEIRSCPHTKWVWRGIR